MHFWEEIKANLHLDPQDPRTWECRPLLVRSVDDGTISFHGNTDVQVAPHADGTADLVADGDRDGWHPSLLNAKVEYVPASTGWLGKDLHRTGLRCHGADAEGYLFTWHINGAAELEAFEMLDTARAEARNSEREVVLGGMRDQIKLLPGWVAPIDLDSILDAGDVSSGNAGVPPS